MIAKTREIANILKLTVSLPTVRYVDPEFVYIAVTNARCAQGEVYVKAGDHVKVGQTIGLRKGPFFEQPIHSTVSGEVVGTVKKFHRSGKLTEFLQIKNDKKDELDDSCLNERTEEEIKQLTKDDFVRIAKETSLVGLGGSSFPTYIKLAGNDPIDTICINAVECEPYLSADHRLIMEFPYRIYRGIRYLMQATGAKKTYICIKKKYQDLFDCLTVAKTRFPDLNVEVKRVGNYYPQGWEIEVIKSALGIQVPAGVLPAKLGVMVLNVSTCVGFYKAVRYNMPVVKRNFTLTGDGIIYPQNYRLRVGTSLQEFIEASGGYKDEDKNKVLILGGPMMGANLVRDDAVITKTCTSCIILNEKKYQEEPCVHCASCVYSCPAGLQPVQIMQAVKNNDKEALKTKLNIKACILCGMCSYTCTSKIHLTDYCRKAKKMAM